MVKHRGRKTPRMRVLEHKRGKPIEEIVVEVYQSGGSVRRAAKALGIAPTSFTSWLERLGLQIAEDGDIARIDALQNEVKV